MKRTNVKPTPGPWRSWPREEGSLITNADGTEAVCHLVITPREPGKRYPALTDANARLIAAAPELLVALRGLLAHLESWKTIEVEGGWIEVARDAISKAERSSRHSTT